MSELLQIKYIQCFTGNFHSETRICSCRWISESNLTVFSNLKEAAVLSKRHLPLFLRLSIMLQLIESKIGKL